MRIAILAALSRARSSGKTYTDYPSTPTFGTTTTINPTDTSIATADLGGNTDVLLGAGAHIPQVVMTGLVGTALNPIRFKGADSDFNNILSADLATATITRMGNNTVTGNYSLRTQSGSDFIELYDLWLYGGTGFKNELSGRGTKMRKVRISDGSFAGILNKTDNTVLSPYPCDYEFVVIHDMEGEGIYIGQVNGPTFHNFSNINIQNCLTYNIGREGIQINHGESCVVSKTTNLFLGQDFSAGASQRRCSQWYDMNGTVSDSIFMIDTGTTYANGQYGAFVLTDGVTFDNCLFDSYDPIYLGNAAAADWYANSTIKGNTEALFNNCIIVARQGTYTRAFRSFLDICNVRVKDCIIYSDAITTLFEDGRNDKLTYSLIDDGGNTIQPLSAYTPPVFNDDYTVNSDYYYNRGMGYRTP